jgi:hypothetical protein
MFKSHLTAVAVGSVITYVTIARPFRKQAKANKIAALLLLDAHATMQKRVNYLAHLIDESDIELDEFDLIAIADPQ